MISKKDNTLSALTSQDFGTGKIEMSYEIWVMSYE